MSLIVGITGGSGSGKSKLTAGLGKCGYPSVDYDKITREVVKPDYVTRADGLEKYRGSTNAYGRILERWPEAFENGVLNRKSLGAIVFRDPAQRAALESIMQTWCYSELQWQLGELHARRIVFLDHPLLAESGDLSLCQMVAHVRAPADLRVERITRRDGISEEVARGRIASQMTDEARDELLRSRFRPKDILNVQGDWQTPMEGFDSVNDVIAWVEEALDNPS